MTDTSPAATNCETGAARPAMGAFRRRKLDSTETNQMAEQAERAGDWTILIAIKAAQKAGQDWRPEVARLRKLNTDNWLRARFMLRADGTDAAVVRLPPDLRSRAWGGA
jgi:hypothetical protein